VNAEMTREGKEATLVFSYLENLTELEAPIGDE
jgi:hypothetical protein